MRVNWVRNPIWTTCAMIVWAMSVMLPLAVFAGWPITREGLAIALLASVVILLTSPPSTQEPGQ